jgi:LmbE family N-acetylglucosaminyl deacetylase
VDEELPRFARVLAVGAHPDDAEFYAGGTLARLRDAGSRVVLAVCTDGSRGGRGRSDVAAVRAREQAAAASLLGVDDVAFLGFEDGSLEACDALRERIVERVRRERPELVLGHDPRTLWIRAGDRVQLGHSDHRAAGQALLDAVYPRAASPNFHPGVGGAPWCPREIWLFDSDAPDLAIDVGIAFERKLDALRAHASQESVAGGLVEAARALARRHGRGERPGEGFVRLRIW